MPDNKNSKTKILIDISCLFDQYSNRGIGRYTKDLLKRLLKLMIESKKWEITLMGFNDLDQNLIAIGFSTFFIEENAQYINYHSLGTPSSSSISNLFKWKTWDKIIYEVEPDLYFAPHFERGLPTTKRLTHTFKRLKTAVTVHDVIPLVNNKFSQKNSIFNYFKGMFYRFMWTGVQDADLIITSSNFSKDDLIKHGNVDEEKVQTVYLGINKEFYKEHTDSIDPRDVDEVLHRFKVKDKTYFFYDSGIEANKGIDNLIHTLRYIFRDASNHIPSYIVITGSDFYAGVGCDIKARSDVGKLYLKKFEIAGILNNIITTSKITDEELQILLSKSEAYIYFSEYEGFGFGPVQAMANEIPSIVNNSSCLPEITDGGSLLVESDKIEITANTVIEFLKDKKHKATIIERGKEVVKKYDWEITAEKTLELFDKLIAGR